MKNEVTRERSSDTVWWALAALLGLGVLWLPQMFKIAETDKAAETLVVGSGLFFAGALLGALRPRRVWRWPLAALIAFVLRDLSVMAEDPEFVFASLPEVWNGLAAHGAVYGTHTIPLLIGAYLGSFLSTEGIR